MRRRVDGTIDKAIFSSRRLLRRSANLISVESVHLRSYLEYGARPVEGPDITRPRTWQTTTSTSFIRAKRPRTAITFGTHVLVVLIFYPSTYVYPLFLRAFSTSTDQTCTYASHAYHLLSKKKKKKKRSPKLVVSLHAATIRRPLVVASMARRQLHRRP